MERLLIICLLLISINDIKKKIIPNSLVIAIALIGILNLISGRVSCADSIVGLLALPLLIWGVHMLTRAKIGMGDIKLISAIGFCLGFWNQVLILCVGMTICMIVILHKRKKTIVLGPFISIGVFISLIIGKIIVK